MEKGGLFRFCCLHTSEAVTSGMNPQAFIARRFVRSRSERVDSRDGFKLSSIILFCFPIHPSAIREIKVCTVDLQPDRLVKMGAGQKDHRGTQG